MKISMLIGLVGKPGCGKGTFPKLLRECFAKDNLYPSIGGPRFSDALVEGLKLFDVLPSRTNLQEFAQWLELKKKGAVTNGMRHKLENDMHEIKIADGVRWSTDEAMIQDLGGILIYIKADPDIRWQRIKLRNEKTGDAEKTFEQFSEEDKAPNEIYIEDIAGRIKNEDCKIDNNGTLEDYANQVRKLYDKLIKPSIQNSKNPA